MTAAKIGTPAAVRTRAMSTVWGSNGVGVI
jgi:hypothetical protein